MILPLACAVLGQPEPWKPALYAFTAGGAILQLDRSSGAATALGQLGHPVGGAAVGDDGLIYTLGDDDDFVRLHPNLLAEVVVHLTGRPRGYSVTGLDFANTGWPPHQVVLVLLSPAVGEDLLYSVSLPQGEYRLIGSTGRSDLEGLYDNSAVSDTGELYDIDIGTGLADPGKPGAPGTSVGGFAFNYCQGMTVYTAGLDLWLTRSGVPRLLGPTGAARITGVAFRDPCRWADCDTTNYNCPVNIFDFLCFQNRFDAGHPYACDADTSTGAGVCDIFDLLAFQNTFQWCVDP